MVAGGITAAVTGFILTGQLMRGQVFSSISSSRNAAKPLIFSGMLIIAEAIGSATLILSNWNLIGGVFGYGVGWGVFQLFMGLAISVTALAAAFIFTGQLMHGRSILFNILSQKRREAVIFSGMLIIAGAIGSAVLFNWGIIGDEIAWWGVGWGIFAELFIGLAIVVLASVTLTSIPEERSD
jgi:heme exporter protein D